MATDSTPNLASGASKRTAATDGITLHDSPPKQRRGKRQLEIPGAEAPSIPELEEQALELVGIKDQLAALRGRVKDLKLEMDETLVEHKLEVYKFVEGGVRRKVKRSTRVTVDVSTEKGKADDDGDEE